MSTKTPTIGRTVHYMLTEQDARMINIRRADFEAFQRSHTHEPGQPGATGHIAHVGNHAEEGQVYPATVVRVFNPSMRTANLQVFLDGTDTYWATSPVEGDGPGMWRWPPRANALDTERLARDAYRAYGEETGGKNFRGEPMPAWEELGDTIRGAWVAATTAVVDRVTDPEK